MKILVYCKNIEADAKALDVAVAHAKAFAGAIELISVIENQTNTPKEVVVQVENRLKEMAAHTAQTHHIPCASQVLTTSIPVGESIVKHAEKNRIDEIIMPLRKRSKLGKLIFGSSSQYIIMEAPCQVMTVK